MEEGEIDCRDICLLSDLSELVRAWRWENAVKRESARPRDRGSTWRSDEATFRNLQSLCLIAAVTVVFDTKFLTKATKNYMELFFLHEQAH